MTPPEMQRKAIFAHLETIMETCDPKVAREALAECGLVVEPPGPLLAFSLAYLDGVMEGEPAEVRKHWERVRAHVSGVSVLHGEVKEKKA